MPKIYFETLNKQICTNAKKPTPARMGVADWWKDMDRYNYDIESEITARFPHRDFSTARSCPALNDAFNFGYILYNPLDAYIDATEEDSISWYVPEINLSVMDSDDQSYIGIHLQKQFKTLKNDSSFHKHALKLNTFFGIRTESGYSSWITHPIGRNDLPFRMLDGIIDTDKHVARFPYGFFIKKGFKGVIKAGTPLIQVIPFRREDFISEIVDSDHERARSESISINLLFTNFYRKFYWTRKKFN